MFRFEENGDNSVTVYYERGDGGTMTVDIYTQAADTLLAVSMYPRGFRDTELEQINHGSQRTHLVFNIGEDMRAG
jgi:hypothetical protein